MKLMYRLMKIMISIIILLSALAGCKSSPEETHAIIGEKNETPPVVSPLQKQTKAIDLKTLFQLNRKEIFEQFDAENGKEPVNIVWSTQSFPKVDIKSLGISLLFFEQENSSKPFSILIPSENDSLEMEFGGVRLGMDFAQINQVLGDHSIEQTWNGNLDNTVYQLNYSWNGLLVSFVSKYEDGKEADVFLSEDYSQFTENNRYKVLNKEHAWNLLSAKLPLLEKENFAFIGWIDDGYSFSSFSDGINEGITFIVDPQNGNVFEYLSHNIITNVFMGEDDLIFSYEEIESLIEICHLNEGYTPYVGEFDHGWYVVSLLDEQGERIKELKVDPAGGDVYSYETNQFLVNLKEELEKHKNIPLEITFDIQKGMDKDEGDTIVFSINPIVLKVGQSFNLRSMTETSHQFLTEQVNYEVLGNWLEDLSKREISATGMQAGETQMEFHVAHDYSLKGTLNVKVIK